MLLHDIWVWLFMLIITPVLCVIPVCRDLVCCHRWRLGKTKAPCSERLRPKSTRLSWVYSSGEFILAAWTRMFPNFPLLVCFCVVSQHYGSRSGHLDVCAYLLENGACASPQTPGGATPLHRAAYCGHLDVVGLLLRHRADPSLCDDDGASPLHKVQIYL